MRDWLSTVEKPVTRDDKYFYQIIKRLDIIIDLLEVKQEIPKFVKPIGTNDEPNENVTVELIHYGNVDEKLGEEIEGQISMYNNMTVKELREIAKSEGIKGYSVLKKDELIDTLQRGD